MSYNKKIIMEADNTIENNDNSKNTIQTTSSHHCIKKHQNSRFNQINYSRIAQIDDLLHSGNTFTVKQLTKLVRRTPDGPEDETFSTRTIQRDLEFMRDTLGAPIESGNDGYRYTEPNFFIKTIPITEGEAFSLAVLNPLLEQYRNTPLENQLRTVFAKITRCLPEKITIDTSFLDPKITFIPDRGEKIDSEFFQTVFDALKSCQTLSFDYRPLQKSTYMERKIDPYHVVCQRGNWYVIGFCHDKGDVRIFSLGRMKNLALMEQRFSVPKDFKPSDYFDAEMGVWLSNATPMTVELLIDREIGTFALNHVWRSEQLVEERADGSVYVKFATTQKQEIIRWVLGQGHTVKVLAPPELAEEIKAELKRTEELYK